MEFGRQRINLNIPVCVSSDQCAVLVATTELKNKRLQTFTFGFSTYFFIPSLYTRYMQHFTHKFLLKVQLKRISCCR